jgi:hypothetical protein
MKELPECTACQINAQNEVRDEICSSDEDRHLSNEYANLFFHRSSHK